MKPFLKSVFVASCLAFCACSQEGAEAQSTSLQTEAAFETNWDVDKANSQIGFTGSQSGEKFSGSFAEYEVRIKFDPDDLEAARVDVTIDTASVDAGDSERNDALPGKEWFSSKAFPKAVFSSNDFTKTGESAYQATGTLTIRDVAKPLVLPFTLEITDGKAVMDSKVSINRSDFNVGTGMWAKEDWVAHAVEIEINLNANRK